MSERFSDEVLHQAVMAYATAQPPVEAAFAAMRAVLEGHLAESETAANDAAYSRGLHARWDLLTETRNALYAAQKEIARLSAASDGSPR